MPSSKTEMTHQRRPTNHHTKPKKRQSAIPMFSVTPPSKFKPTLSEGTDGTNTSPVPRSTSKSIRRRKSLFSGDMGMHRWDSTGEEESFVPTASIHSIKTVSRRERLADFLSRNGWDRILDWTQAFFSLIAVVIYVVQTYYENLWLMTWVLVLEIFIGTFFLFDYILGK